MEFYEEWEKEKNDDERNSLYIKKFLLKDKESLTILEKGTTQELVFACKLLLSIPIDNFINCIDEDKQWSTDKVIQFSNLEHAIVDVPRIIKFNDKPMTFSELGKAIIKAKEDGACKKYGENHAKVANELSMVIFNRKTAIEVSTSSFGNFSIGLSSEDRIELVKRLILRNEFIQKIIYLAKNGIVNYMDVACELLSKSTAIRRKSNVRQLINLVAMNSNICSNIVW